MKPKKKHGHSLKQRLKHFIVVVFDKWWARFLLWAFGIFLVLFLLYTPYFLVIGEVTFRRISFDNDTLTFFLNYTQTVVGSGILVATFLITFIATSMSIKANKRQADAEMLFQRKQFKQELEQQQRLFEAETKLLKEQRIFDDLRAFADKLEKTIEDKLSVPVFKILEASETRQLTFRELSRELFYQSDKLFFEDRTLSIPYQLKQATLHISDTLLLMFQLGKIVAHASTLLGSPLSAFPVYYALKYNPFLFSVSFEDGFLYQAILRIPNGLQLLQSVKNTLTAQIENPF